MHPSAWKGYSTKFVYGIMLRSGPVWLRTIRYAQMASSEENQMSIFPTKILLATDGSSEARLAARTAVDLAQKTDSEVHLIHVFDVALIALLYPEATDSKGVKVPEPILEEDLQRHAREVLDGEV
jgi:Universal stress protein family